MDRRELRILPEQSQLSAVDDPGEIKYVCLTPILKASPTATTAQHGSYLVYMLQGLQRPPRFYRRQLYYPKRCGPAKPIPLPWCIRAYVVSMVSDAVCRQLRDSPRQCSFETSNKTDQTKPQETDAAT